MALVALAVMVVFAFAACSSSGGPKAECKGCHMMADKTCPKDGLCAKCDKCTGKCEGCKMDVKCMDLCPKCQKCKMCDKCGK